MLGAMRACRQRAADRSSRPGRTAFRAALSMLTATAIAGGQVTPASAQSMSFIRDAELEELMRDYAMPIIRAAGLSSSAVRVYIVNSAQFNAFVVDGRRIFINAGVLLQSDVPNEVIGIIAHEAGHIAGGHLARLRTELSGAAAMSILAAILGAGAMAAGAASGMDSGAQAGHAMVMGGQHMAQRSLLAYQRGEEQAADRAAINYLNATGQSARGMLTTFERIADQQLFSSRYADPYAQSHPMPRDRVTALEHVARQSPHFERRDPPELQARHDLARAKLSGFMEHPSSVLRRYPQSDQSLPARYARTILDMRSGNYRAALQGVDALVATQPGNPYFRELKGEMLIRAGRPGDALEPLRQAVNMEPDAPLIRITLGQALVATGDNRFLDEAIRELNTALRSEPEHSGGYRHLAMAYGRAGRVPEAELASAQGHFASGNLEMAQRFAQRAKQGLPTGSPAWLRADDILNSKPPGT